MTEAINRFEKHFSAFDAPEKSALRRIFEFACIPDITVNGSDISFVTDDYPTFKRTLTLKNVDGNLKQKEGWYLYQAGLVYKKEKNKYCFYGECEHPDDETTELFAVNFDSASVDIQLFNGCENLYYLDQPWQLIRTVCSSIKIKADLPGDFLNEKEKALLSLIKEIDNIEYWFEEDKPQCVSFDNLKALANKYGYKKVTALLSKLETIIPTDSKFEKCSQKLISLLNEHQHEPMLREIYDKLLESQENYPNNVETICNKEKLSSIRNKIQKLMESHGYIGTYPDFVKDGTLDGIHLERSYDMSYWVGFEKYAQYHIHCEESYFDPEQLQIQFCCGAAFFKNGEQDTDIFGCMFNAKGKRLFYTVEYFEGHKCDLQTVVNIAVKKAECKKLLKQEKDDFFGKMPSAFSTFFWIYLVAGGMFGIIMTLAMMLLCAVVCAVTVGISEIPEMFKQMPWLLILAIGWVGFGGTFGVVEILSMRK